MFTTDELRELKLSVRKQQEVLHKINKPNDSAVEASFALANLIATKCRPHTEGEFIRECLIKKLKLFVKSEMS